MLNFEYEARIAARQGRDAEILDAIDAFYQSSLTYYWVQGRRPVRLLVIQGKE